MAIWVTVLMKMGELLCFDANLQIKADNNVVQSAATVHFSLKKDAGGTRSSCWEKT